MAAFEAAVELGYRYLETDVRVTADGVALAFHDASLDRLTDGHGRIAELSWAQVRTARIDGREPIPLLTDVLTAWPDVCVNLDVKAANGIAVTADAIRRTGAIDQVCVGAFAESRVAGVRRLLGPRLCTSLGPRAAIALRVPGARRPRRMDARCAQVPARAGRLAFTDERYVARAHSLGLQVHVWTVNDPAEMRRVLDAGADGVMTDRADVLRAVLLERGAWTGR